MWWEPIGQAFLWGSRFCRLSVWKVMAFEMSFSKTTFSDFFLIHYWAKQKQEATKTILSYILIFLTFFLGGGGEKEVWRVSTSTGPRRTRRLSSGVDAVTSSSYSVRDHELPGKSSTTVSTSTNVSSWQGILSDNSQVSQLEQYK